MYRLINYLTSITTIMEGVYDENASVRDESAVGIMSQSIRRENPSKSPRLPPVDINY